MRRICCVARSAALHVRGNSDFLDAVRLIIVSSKEFSRLTTEEIASQLESALPGKCDPTLYGYSRFADVISELNTDCYIVEGKYVVPCDWEKVIQSIRKKLPLEGVLEPTLLRFLSAECPSFSAQSVPGQTLESWIAKRFPAIIQVSRSVEENIVIYRPKESVSDAPVVQNVLEALKILGREDIPVFTDYTDLVAISPQAIPLQELLSEHVKGLLEIDVDVMMTERSGLATTLIVIDGSTVRANQCDGAISKEKVNLQLVKRVIVLRRNHDPPHSAGDSIFSNLLDAHHAIGALLSELEKGVRRVVVVCSEEAVPSMKESLKEQRIAAELVFLSPK